MSDDPIFGHLQELSWRRPLTSAEQDRLRAWLAAHPEAQADWESEAQLNEALRTLPDAPVPSNFTARVLQAVEREGSPARHPKGTLWDWLRTRWVPRVAFAAVIVSAGVLSYHQFQIVHRKHLARSVAAVSAVASLPSPEILKDFDAIRAMNPAPAPDEQLLAVLQ